MPAYIPYPWPAIIARNFVREGGDKFTNHPEDFGGPTKYGITLNTLRNARGNPNLTAEDVRNLTRDEAIQISYDVFAKPWQHLFVPANLLEILYDTGFLFSPMSTALILQRAINDTNRRVLGPQAVEIAEDGIIGHKTIAALTTSDYAILTKFLLLHRINLHIQRVVAKPSQLVFLQGWSNRVMELSRL